MDDIFKLYWTVAVWFIGAGCVSLWVVLALLHAAWAVYRNAIGWPHIFNALRYYRDKDGLREDLLQAAASACLSAPLKHPNQDVREACANAVLGLGEK